MVFSVCIGFHYIWIFQSPDWQGVSTVHVHNLGHKGRGKFCYLVDDFVLFCSSPRWYYYEEHCRSINGSARECHHCGQGSDLPIEFIGPDREAIDMSISSLYFRAGHI